MTGIVFAALEWPSDLIKPEGHRSALLIVGGTIYGQGRHYVSVAAYPLHVNNVIVHLEFVRW